MTSDALTALTDESRALSAVLHDLGPVDLARTTNCPPWDLQELVVHIADSINVGEAPFDPSDDQVDPASAADYYRRPERATASYRQDNVDRTQRLARSVLADSSAVQWFDEISHRTIARLSERNLDQVVLIPGRGPMRFADWVVTRVIAVAAHGLDVAITIGRAPWTTPSALRVARPVFVALLGAPPPDGLNWDDQTLLATATGRRELADREVGVLGPRAERFPLLS